MNGQVNGDQYVYPGSAQDSRASLTKRELFAGLAMQGFCARSEHWDSSSAMAEDAVELADALLRALAVERAP